MNDMTTKRRIIIIVVIIVIIAYVTSAEMFSTPIVGIHLRVNVLGIRTRALRFYLHKRVHGAAEADDCWRLPWEIFRQRNFLFR